MTQQDPPPPVGPRIEGDESAIEYVVLDRETATSTLIRSDRMKATVPLDRSPFEDSSQIARVVYPPRGRWMYLETVHGDPILAELPDKGEPTPLGDRLVVYLDQKDWRDVADALHGEGTGNRRTDDAARHLARWVATNRIVLPLSGGHHSETTEWPDGEGRYRLGLTMAQLSRGWQMRHPLAVRRAEVIASFTRVFRGKTTCVPHVFTLEPDVAFGQNDSNDQQPEVSDVPPDDSTFRFEATRSVLVSFDTILDAEPIDKVMPAAWVERQQSFTRWLAAQVGPPQQKKKAIELFFIEDTLTELEQARVEAHLTREQLGEWLTDHRRREVTRMPALGLFREMLVERHLNKTTKWEDSDLVDLMYLSVAGGYADIVAAEKRAVTHMRQATHRLGRDLNAHRNIGELVAALGERLDGDGCAA